MLREICKNCNDIDNCSYINANIVQKCPDVDMFDYGFEDCIQKMKESGLLDQEKLNKLTIYLYRFIE